VHDAVALRGRLWRALRIGGKQDKFTAKCALVKLERLSGMSLKVDVWTCSYVTHG
jgi:hypothetical protein